MELDKGIESERGGKNRGGKSKKKKKGKEKKPWGKPGEYSRRKLKTNGQSRRK